MRTERRATAIIVAAAVVAMTALPAGADTADKPYAAPTGTLDGQSSAVDITQDQLTASAGGKQQYRYDNLIIYWSVTAVRANEGTSKADVSLFEDGQNDKLLARSKEKGAAIDFVVVDSNHAPAPSTWYPTVSSKGIGTYDVQNDTDEGYLRCNGTLLITLAPQDVVAVADVYVPPGMQSTITASGGGDARLFLMKSKEGASTSWYQPRSKAIASSNGGAGDERLDFTSAGDYYGLVLTQSTGWGTYTLTQTCA